MNFTFHEYEYDFHVFFSVSLLSRWVSALRMCVCFFVVSVLPFRNINILLMNFLLLKHFRRKHDCFFCGIIDEAVEMTKKRASEREIERTLPIEMKFDDKLLPSENDLSQNEYKAAFFSLFSPILPPCTRSKRKTTFMWLFSMPIVKSWCRCCP